MDTKGRIYDMQEGILDQLKSDGLDPEDVMGRLYPLTQEEAEALKPSPEAERLAQLELIRKHPLTSIGDLSDSDARKIRNAAKRARRAQRGK